MSIRHAILTVLLVAFALSACGGDTSGPGETPAEDAGPTLSPMPRRGI